MNIIVSEFRQNILVSIVNLGFQVIAVIPFVLPFKFCSNFSLSPTDLRKCFIDRQFECEVSDFRNNRSAIMFNSILSGVAQWEKSLLSTWTLTAITNLYWYIIVLSLDHLVVNYRMDSGRSQSQQNSWHIHTCMHQILYSRVHQQDSYPDIPSVGVKEGLSCMRFRG